MRRLLMTWKPVLLGALLLAIFGAMPALAMAAQGAPPPPNVPPQVSTFVLTVIAAAVPVMSWGLVEVLKRYLRVPPLVKLGLSTLLGFLVPLIPGIHVEGAAAWVIYPLLSAAAVTLDQAKKYLSGELA